MLKRVLITGHTGYIGSVMTPFIQAHGYDVVGLDVGFFNECNFMDDGVAVPEIARDLRDLQPSDLAGFDAVIHLAALSNDAIGNLKEEWTEAINFHGSVRLAELAKGAGVRRFLFSSSCIMYGQAEADVVTEESPLDPKTEYARSKVRAEAAIAAMAGDGFSPTFLRNGTVYGTSPRMRFDTVLNNLTGMALTTGKVVLHGDGTPWRPVVHIEDVARAFLRVLEAPLPLVHNQAFNNGCDAMNHQIIELAETLAVVLPGTRIERLARPDADQRTYRASFAKFARTFPDFKFRWNVCDGARELVDAFRGVGLTHEQFVDPKFTRLRWLRALLDDGRLDGSLRWAARAVTA